MGQHEPSTNRPLSAWIPDDAWTPIDDPAYREPRRELEKRIGRDLATITDRVAPWAYAEALGWMAALFAYPDPSTDMEDARLVNPPRANAGEGAGYRRALESIGPAGDPMLLVAVGTNLQQFGLLRMTWRGYVEHFALTASSAVAADGSWLFLDNEGKSAVSGRPRAGHIHSIAQVAKYRTSNGAIVGHSRLIVHYGHGPCWESMRIGYGGDYKSNELYAQALSWLTGLPILEQEFDAADPTQVAG